MNINGGYTIDMDISKYFDSIPHQKLREVLEQRIRDGVIRRTIGKWLKAGVMEQGQVQYPDKGTPQGGVISPLLSNIYLHEVLDEWFVKTVKPCLRGKAFMVRYASDQRSDDAIIGCEFKEDADRIMKVLVLRFEKYGLTIHPMKTKLVDFTTPTGDQWKGNGSFTFLGFKHFWKKSRKNRWIIGRKTDSKRLSRALQRIALWCGTYRHLSRKEQHEKLTAKLKGHYAYYGIWLNFNSIALFYQEVQRIWFKWLNRRSDRISRSWEQYTAYLKNFPLPAPRIVHSYS
jgi:group II intron reverse transcriptase/maturase